MTPERASAEAVKAAIRTWARGMGVSDDEPLTLAMEKAELALEEGSTVEEACAVGLGLVVSWLRHPSHPRWLDGIVAADGPSMSAGTTP